MKKLMLVLLVAVAMVSCSKKETTEEAPALTVSEFILQADQLLDSTVTVYGIVDHICMGSKAKIHFVCTGNPDENIKIFANEQMGVFDDSLIGKTIKVIGKVAVNTKIDNEYLDNWEAELAEEHDADADAEEEGHHHDGEEPETHHHGNQAKLIEKYRKMVAGSENGYINLYKIIVDEVIAMENPEN